MKLLRLASTAAVALSLAFASQASAVTVDWVGYANPEVQDSQGNQVGPYQLRIDGGPVFKATCITGRLDVPVPNNDPWEANVYRGDLAPQPLVISGNTIYSDLTQVQQAATLNTLWGAYDTASVQHAIWALFDGGLSSAYLSGDATASSLYTDVTTGGMTLVAQDSYQVIAANSLVTWKDKQGNTFTGPQVFITPEPCSLALLGLGMAAVGLRRRRRKA